MKRMFLVEKRTLQWLTIAIGASVLWVASAHGQATVEPETQPALTLAPYVLKSTNLEPRAGNESGGTRAYRPWFENGAWTGDLIEYEISKDGERLPRGDGNTGRYPSEGVAGWRGSSPLWSARYKFPDWQPFTEAAAADPNWVCTEEIPDYWETRNIYTTSGGARVDFLWDSLSPAQRTALDPVAAADDTLDTEQYGSLVLRYVRGDRSRERCKPGMDWRMRYSLLGAIINSRPAYVPVGTDGLVVVGANDGMVHGFNAANGTEQFSYVPSMLLDKVGLIRSDAQIRPRYLVDGELRHRDIGSSQTPRHIVTGGLGAGGKGLFVLDVSSTLSIVQELSGVDRAHIGGSYNANIGHIHGRPNIARLPDNSAEGYSWYVASGNGYGSDENKARLVLIPLDGSPAPPPIDTDDELDNGLSAPALLDATGNGVVDFAYAGDLRGRLWRFDLKTRTASILFDAGPGRPITVEPDIANHPDTLEGFMVYFGTGSLLSADDVQVTTQQSVYGIWDRGNGNEVLANRLVSQELVTESVTWTIPDSSHCAVPTTGTAPATVRFIKDQKDLDWSGTSPDLGWRVDLPPNSGERLIGHPQVRAERVQFITTNPADTANPPRDAQGNFLPDAGSWMLQLDLATGGNAKPQPRALFDLNKNCALDLDDGLPSTVNLDGVSAGAFPVGINLGPYNVAQPAFARVSFNQQLGSVVDGVYINALQLPTEDPPSLRPDGPIDVTTDSAFGDAHGHVRPEPVKEPFGQRVFPEATAPTKPFLRADGIGHRVSGHSFGYNKHHGVNYVDLFDLEPREGMLRLDVGTMYWDEIENELKPITPRISERELNKITDVDVGIDDVNQHFIVMITNADLSQDNEIQIGCRTWRVYDYQTRMMQSLKKWYDTPQTAMEELDADDLIFTINGTHNPILQDTGCLEPTIRITPTELVSKPGTLIATMPGCVNNTDIYRGPNGPGYAQTRKPELQPNGVVVDPKVLYKTDPHVTDNSLNSTGYSGRRWRNGALTIQILAVNDNLSSAFVLQDEKDLPVGTGFESIDRGFGGAYAKAFNIPTSGPDRDVVIPLTDGLSVPSTAVSGMLYELSMFWHLGDMTRLQQEGLGNRRPVCYGGSTQGNVIQFESDWFAKYQNITSEFNEDLQIAYVTELARLLSNDEATVLDAIEKLEALFAQHGWLRDYHRVRHHAFHESHQHIGNLIMIDRGGVDLNLAGDGTPADVLDIERDLLPSLGPNYQPGRRSWMDLTPEN